MIFVWPHIDLNYAKAWRANEDLKAIVIPNKAFEIS